MNVLLGSNVINNCDGALFVNGHEVFRLREGQSNSQLICDFDIQDSSGKRIAKISKNKVVFAADGLKHESTASLSRVIDGNGTVLASVMRLDQHTIKICGVFHIDGHIVTITDNALHAGGITMSGNIISGFGKAISLDPGSFSIGSR